jgi:hypothetical protein
MLVQSEVEVVRANGSVLVCDARARGADAASPQANARLRNLCEF